MMKIYKICFCLLTLALSAGFDASACTTAIIGAKVSGTGRPMLWKNQDSDSPWHYVAHSRGTKYAYTAMVSYAGSAWVGANEVGFAIGNNVSYNPPDTRSISSGSIMAEALGCCATVDDFEALLNSQPLPWNVGTNFAVIDGQGGGAYFETGNYGFVRYNLADDERGYIVRTNFSLSGEGKGKGYERFDTATRLFGNKQRGFTPDWILNIVARDFSIPLTSSGTYSVYKDVNIPRYTNTSSVVVEGINPADNKDGVMLWCSTGYTPASYAIPVWVAAGDEIPSCIAKAHAPAREVSNLLKERIFPMVGGSRGDYVDEKFLFEKAMPLACGAEQTESFWGIRLRLYMEANGFDLARIKRLNRDIDRRFDKYCIRVNKILSE